MLLLTCGFRSGNVRVLLVEKKPHTHKAGLEEHPRVCLPPAPPPATQAAQPCVQLCLPQAPEFPAPWPTPFYPLSNELRVCHGV